MKYIKSRNAFLFFKKEDFKIGIVKSLFFNVFSKVLLFLNSIFLANNFHSSQTDIYFFVFSTVTLISFLINGLDGSVLIPQLMRLGDEKDLERKNGLINFFLFGYSILGFLIAIVFFLGINYFWSSLSNISQIDIEENKNIFIWGAVLIPLMILNSLQTSILSSFRYFTIPVMASAVANSLSLVLLIFGGDYYSSAISFVGLCVGYFCLVVYFFYFMKVNIGWTGSLNTSAFSRSFFTNSKYVLTGNLLSILYSYSNLFVLNIIGNGYVSFYNYSQQIINIPANFVLNQFSTIAGLKFNELAITGNFREINTVFVKSLSLIFFFLIPFSLTLFFLSNDLITIIFTRGNFGQLENKATSFFLKYLVVIVPIFTLNTFLTKLIYTFQLIKQGVVFQFVVNLCLIVGSLLGSLFFNIYGFVFSAIFVYCCYFIFMGVFIFKKYFKFIDFNKVLRNLLFIIFNNLIIASALNILIKNTEIALVRCFLFCLAFPILIILTNRIIEMNKDINLYIDNFLIKFSSGKTK
jgi:putative peptidoglycan lipid II flippase